MSPGSEDHTLLRSYAQMRDPAVFATLVHRYVPLVYSAAARRVGDRHLAHDITQAVFVILSQKPPSLSDRQPLSAWLLTTVRYAASNALKIESRRRQHETAAAMLNSSIGTCSSDPSEAILWQDVSRQLDDAVLRLSSLDRRAILLRYFEDRPIRDIAVTLNCSEGAVKQRLSRALEKLRARLDRASTGGLAAFSADQFSSLLSTHAIRPPPPGLAAATTSVALSSTTTAITSSAITLHIAKGAINMMTWTKAKLVATIVVAFTLAGVGGVATLNHARAQTDTPAPAPAATEKDKKSDNYLGIVTVADAPPVVIETFPKTGSADVDPATTELKVTFSKDMADGGWSWAQISDSTYPKTTGKSHYLDDHRTCVLPVKLEPNHTYILQLNYPPFVGFADPEGRKAVRYLLVFQTRS